MGYQTPYDKKRDELRIKLEECRILAKELAMGHDIPGFEEMVEDYGINLYMTIKEARDRV